MADPWVHVDASSLRRRLGRRVDGQVKNKRRAFSRFRFETGLASVFFDDAAVDDGQALARAFAYGFGGEERFKNARAVRFRNARARVAHADFGVITLPPGAHGDLAFAARILFDDVADGVGGIDDQIEDDLVEFAEEAGDGRQRRVEFQREVSDILPFISRHGRRGLDGFVEVHRGLFLAARMRKFLHGPDNLRDAVHAFESFPDGGGDLFEEITEIAGLERFLDAAD